MNRRAITTFCAISSALFLLIIGILHGIVNVLGLRRAIERGEIPTRLGDSVLVNAAFSGAAMSVLGLFVLLLLPGIRAGSAQARRVATAIGIFIGIVSAASYLWVPTRPSVLIFLFFGALLAVPLVIWKRETRQPVKRTAWQQAGSASWGSRRTTRWSRRPTRIII